MTDVTNRPRLTTARVLRGVAGRTRDAVAGVHAACTLAPRYSAPPAGTTPEQHLREAAGWLIRAQDAGTDRGFAYGARFDGPFLPSYPETTGYIIPTFLRLADAFGDKTLERRAVQAGDWEIAVQMASGAVTAGILGTEPAPAVFNTGQVLLGWTALFERTHERRFQDAVVRAADWLMSVQEPDGRWVRGNSPVADGGATTYNVKAAWGLCRAGVVCEHQPYIDAAIRNAEHAVRQQADNGWFRNCCLTDPARPLLHTLAYTAQGLMGIGTLTKRADLVAAARRTADSLLGLMRANGFIPGRIRADFHGDVKWCCLTGSAQTSIVWAALYRTTGVTAYRDACARVNAYLRSKHDVTSPHTTIRGGVPGSWPVWGEYGRYTVLNWATKFFADALLAEQDLDAPVSAFDRIPG